MAKLDQVVTGDKLLYHDKEFWKEVNKKIPKNTGDLTNNDNTVHDANYVHTDSNYTVDEKNKLAGIANSAQANVIESVSVNGTALPITKKGVNVTVPTNISDLKNDDNTVKDANYVHTDNNYTKTEKDKLAGVASNAQVNVIESVSVNGTKQTVTNKGVNVTVPTKVSDLNNDQKYQTESQVQTTVNKAVASAPHLKRKNVTALPTTDIDNNTIYMVPDPKGKTGNEKIEYMYDSDAAAWEQIGTTMTDLDGYVKNTDVTEITNEQVDSIISQTFATA